MMNLTQRRRDAKFWFVEAPFSKDISGNAGASMQPSVNPIRPRYASTEQLGTVSAIIAVRIENLVVIALRLDPRDRLPKA